MKMDEDGFDELCTLIDAGIAGTLTLLALLIMTKFGII